MQHPPSTGMLCTKLCSRWCGAHPQPHDVHSPANLCCKPSNVPPSVSYDPSRGLFALLPSPGRLYLANARRFCANVALSLLIMRSQSWQQQHRHQRQRGARQRQRQSREHRHHRSGHCRAAGEKLHEHSGTLVDTLPPEAAGQHCSTAHSPAVKQCIRQLGDLKVPPVAVTPHVCHEHSRACHCEHPFIVSTHSMSSSATSASHV